jgi:hypothetical protein
MMSALHKVFFWLESFERDGHVKNAMTKVLDNDELVAAITWINSLPDGEQMMLKGRLTKLSLAVENHRQCLIAEMKVMGHQIIASQETVHAHMAYLQAACRSKPRACH